MSRTQLLALVAGISLAATTLFAGPARPPQAGPKGPKVIAPKAVSVKGPKAPKVNGPKVKPVKAQAGPKAPAGAKGPKAPKASKPVPPGHAKRAGTPAGAKAGRPAHAKGPNAADGATAIPKNEKLVARLQALLPAGMTVEQAAEGFRNQGQFIAAVRVSNNLGIPFADLKTSMVADGRSLGQSIQTLRPGIDADAETTRATRWANQQIETAQPLEPR